MKCHLFPLLSQGKEREGGGIMDPLLHRGIKGVRWVRNEGKKEGFQEGGGRKRIGSEEGWMERVESHKGL